MSERAARDYLQQFVRYVANTGTFALPAAWFDDDWQPIGPRVRADLVAAGLIVETGTTLSLTDAGRELAAVSPSVGCPRQPMPADCGLASFRPDLFYLAADDAGTFHRADRFMCKICGLAWDQDCRPLPDPMPGAGL